MDLSEKARQLAEIEGHIAAAALHIARQRELIADLECAAADTTEAKALLASFEQTLRLHIERRDGLQSELPD